jgi:hypothetical protein
MKSHFQRYNWSSTPIYPIYLGAAISICVDWGIPVYFCGGRQTAKRFVEAYLERYARAINERDLG